MLRRLLPALLLLLLPCALQAQREKLPPEDLDWVEKNFPDAKKSNTGIRYIEIEQGSGETAKRGDMVSMLYIGRFINGDSFDQRIDPAKPFQFRLGRGKVIDPAFGADDRVVAPVIRRVVALRVGREHAVAELHLHRTQVLDINTMIEPAHLGRRKEREVHFVHRDLARCAGVGFAARQLVVKRQRAERIDRATVTAAQPVDDVDVVRGLLQQQAVGVTALGMPVAEIEIAAVADKVAAPAGFDLADRSARRDSRQEDRVLHSP